MNHSSILSPSFALGLALLLSTSPARAQLGESEQTIRQRFGAPTATEPETDVEKAFTFEKPGVLTVIDFRGGKCVNVTVTKIEGELSAVELQQILKANAQGKTWQHDEQDPDVWRRSDGILAYATVGFVSIVSPAEEKKSTGAEIGDPRAQKAGQ